MIEVKNLKIQVWQKQILKWLNISFEVGKNYLVLWKNGSGKSSLSQFLMGNPSYEYVEGTVTIDEKNILQMSPSERSQAGLFLSFQQVPEIPWIQLWEYLRIIYNNSKTSPLTPLLSGEGDKKDFKWLSPFVFKRFLKKFLDELQIPEVFLSRDLNVWFSWWEKRKIELLQAKLLGPKYIILDEIDSGLDIDAFSLVSESIKKMDQENNALIIITHHFKIVDYVNFDTIYILKDGKVEKTGGKELIENIKQYWFE